MHRLLCQLNRVIMKEHCQYIWIEFTTVWFTDYSYELRLRYSFLLCSFSCGFAFSVLACVCASRNEVCAVGWCMASAVLLLSEHVVNQFETEL